MPESIFRIGSEGELEKVEETFVADEDRLQELLARYPDVLAGNQMSRAAPVGPGCPGGCSSRRS